MDERVLFVDWSYNVLWLILISIFRRWSWKRQEWEPMDAIVVGSSFHSTYAVVSVDSIYSVYLTWNTYDTLYFRAFLLWRENIIIVRLQVVVEKYFVRHPYSYWITVQYCSKGIYAQQYLNRADLQTSTWLSLSQTRTDTARPLWTNQFSPVSSL